MKFSDYAEYLSRLEKTPKRLEITAILQELLEKLSPDDTREAVFLSLGILKAPFENPKFNIAEKMMLRVLVNAYNRGPEEIKNLYSKSGDLGDVAHEIAPKGKAGLSIKEVYSKLEELASIEGAGSQEAKIQKLTGILSNLDSLSAKYVVRIVLGTTRLGFTELTIIEALNKAVGGTKATKAQIEMRYNLHPDIGLIAEEIKKNGLKGVDKIGIEPGVPIIPQKCQRLADVEEIIEKMGTVQAEFKFDGTRVQLHLDRKKTIKSKDSEQNTLFGDGEEQIFVKTYTRNLEETTYQYPDIVEAAIKQIDAESVILDGEAIGYNKDTGDFLPFQEIMQRKRKHDIAEMAKEVPLKYFVFDILYINGRSLVNETLEKRREILRNAIKAGKVIEVDTSVTTSKPDVLREYFEEAKERGLEGLVIKKAEAPYQAGAREYTWVKLKKADTRLLEDTVDTVILGYYFGRGVRAGFGIGGFLAGVYDPKTDKYKSITKVGTGLTDEVFQSLKSQLDKIRVEDQPAMVDINKMFVPNVWVKPELVAELAADEVTKSSTHTTGYALRFPRLIKIRKDKKPTDTTSPEEITNIYNNQKRGSYK